VDAAPLIAAGIRAISLPVDITNYVMLELGQPMHAFDLGRLAAAWSCAGPAGREADHPGRRRPRARRRGHGDLRRHRADLAGRGDGRRDQRGQPDTVDVLLEAAHWDPVMVGRTARRHKLFSEAAKRWERGVDPQLPLVALERAVEMLTAHAGGTVDEPSATSTTAVRSRRSGSRPNCRPASPVSTTTPSGSAPPWTPAAAPGPPTGTRLS
jgi:phenylalanyl-tRNA synthetase beta chain